MRRMLSVVLLALAATLVTSPASAQRYSDRHYGFSHQTVASLHLGVSMPTGDFGDVFESGLGFGGSIGYGVGRQLLLSANISHHEFDSDIPGLEASTTPITFNLDYIVPTSGNLMPWVGGGLGIYNVEIEDEEFDFEADESNFGINLGAGLAGRVGNKTLLGGGFRYHMVSDGDEIDDTPFLTLQFGVGFLL